MNQVLAFLDGKKTLIAGAVSILIGILVLSGKITDPTVIAGLIAGTQGAAVIFLRMAVSKAPPPVRQLLEKAIDNYEQSFPKDLQPLVAELRVATVDDKPLPEPETQYNYQPPAVVSPRDVAGILLIGCLCLPGCSNLSTSEPPKIVVNAPKSGVPGETLVFDWSQSKGSNVSYKVAIEPELYGYQQIEHSDPKATRARIAGFGGRYRVRISGFNSVAMDEWTGYFEIPGTPPCPKPVDPLPPPPVLPITPTPVEPVKPTEPTPIKPVEPVKPPEPVKPVTPPAPVDPTPPMGEFGVAPDVYRLAKSSKSPTRVADCLKLAKTCREIGNKSWSSINDVASAMVAELLALPSGWDDLKKKVKETFVKLNDNGNGPLQSANDLCRLLLELAPAFEAAAK